MPPNVVGSASFSDDVTHGTHHFKWMSIGNLLFIAFTYSAHPSFFYMFNHLDPHPVRVCQFTIIALVIGMTYMCMDLFIKQYTRRLDWNGNLSPVLKSVTIPTMLQSAMYCLLHVRYAGDGARYLASSLASTPIWAHCSNDFNASTCLDSRYVLHHCEKLRSLGSKDRLPLNMTSVHLHYMTYTKSNSKGTLTWRFFVSAVIWILNFCLTTIPDTVVLKFFKYVAITKGVSVILTCVFLEICTGHTKETLYKLMDIKRHCSIIQTVVQVALVYGIGMIGIYDFGKSSTFTMVDNTVVIFTVCFIIISIVKSLIVDMLMMEVTYCVDMNVDEPRKWHYILFAILPLATEFLYGQKLINVFLYLFLILSLLPCLMLNTLMMTRLFHSEFPSIKIIYIEGLLCLLGFGLSFPILVVDKYVDELRTGFVTGLACSALYLGGLKMAIVMWVYGVKKFSTDINFWLGFFPTKFWILCWTVGPVLLLIAFGYRIFIVLKMKGIADTVALVWFLISALIVLVLQTRTVVHYVMQNNLMGAFRSNKKYGPPDPRDRKRRRRYDVIIDHRECFHGCMPIDEEVDCNHLPLMNTAEMAPSEASESSLTQMYENAPVKSASVVTLVETTVEKKDKKA